jgi:hypothetical protein
MSWGEAVSLKLSHSLRKLKKARPPETKDSCKNELKLREWVRVTAGNLTIASASSRVRLFLTVWRWRNVYLRNTSDKKEPWSCVTTKRTIIQHIRI